MNNEQKQLTMEIINHFVDSLRTEKEQNKLFSDVVGNSKSYDFTVHDKQYLKQYNILLRGYFNSRNIMKSSRTLQVKEEANIIAKEVKRSTAIVEQKFLYMMRKYIERVKLI